MVYRITTDKDFEDVRALAVQGVGLTGIAKALGLPITTVQYRVKKLVQSGAMLPMVKLRKRAPPSPKMRVAEMRDRYGVRLGGMSDLTGLLSKKELEWLYTCTPKGATVVEFVASLIRDAHAEEVSE